MTLPGQSNAELGALVKVGDAQPIHVGARAIAALQLAAMTQLAGAMTRANERWRRDTPTDIDTLTDLRYELELAIIAADVLVELAPIPLEEDGDDGAS